ncbi:uncharacterized protein LOC135332060 isoform X4 [Halichondria panicea]|uniref:uncharacterized protein LOC135332060 isoform X4 n=1 Tax=Halichondria panicea TaxID=6063 RepID=UPI00312BAFB3
MVCCRCKKGLCTNCCSTRCSNQASSSTQCAALLPNPLALARGLTLRLKRCVPASQLVPPPPKRKCSTPLFSTPPPEQPQTSLQVHLVHQQKPSQKMH